MTVPPGKTSRRMTCHHCHGRTSHGIIPHKIIVNGEICGSIPSCGPPSNVGSRLGEKCLLVFCGYFTHGRIGASRRQRTNMRLSKDIDALSPLALENQRPDRLFPFPISLLSKSKIFRTFRAGAYKMAPLRGVAAIAVDENSNTRHSAP